MQMTSEQRELLLSIIQFYEANQSFSQEDLTHSEAVSYLYAAVFHSTITEA